MVEVIAISNRCELLTLEIETEGSIRYSYYLYHEDIPMVRS